MYLHEHLGGLVSESGVKLCRYMYERKAKSWSEDVISKLGRSATKSISMDGYKTAFAWTLHQLDQDHELEDFFDMIPSLYQSNVFATPDISNVKRNVHHVLAALPRPSSYEPLPWSVIRIAQRAITNKLSKPIQQRRTQTCLRALYHIPGAIRDVLAPYAVGKYYCLEVLPLLNSPESLKIIDELWDSSNDDVALSVRCAAAVVAAFMITPPRCTLDNFVTPTDGFIGENFACQQFLARRLRIKDGGVAPGFLPNSDNARLQNIVRFLEDIEGTLHFMNTQWWASDEADLIRRQRQDLYDKRHKGEYALGHGTFDQQGDRTSPAFVPAAQQDLIVLTLEILARDPVVDAATSQREAFDDVCTRLEQDGQAQFPNRPLHLHVVQDSHARERELLQDLALRWMPTASVSFGMVKQALEPVFLSLLQSQNITPRADPLQLQARPSQML